MNEQDLKDIIFDGNGRSIEKKSVDKRQLLIGQMQYHLRRLKDLISIYKSIEDTSKTKELLDRMNDYVRNAQSSWWNIKSLFNK